MIEVRPRPKFLARRATRDRLAEFVRYVRRSLHDPPRGRSRPDIRFAVGGRGGRQGRGGSAWFEYVPADRSRPFGVTRGTRSQGVDAVGGKELRFNNMSASYSNALTRPVTAKRTWASAQ